MSVRRIPAGLVCMAAFLIATPLASFAQGAMADSPASAPRHGGHPHGPPPEAIAACSGKAVGTVVTFTDRRGNAHSGACVQQGDVVAVERPARGPNEQGGPSSAGQAR